MHDDGDESATHGLHRAFDEMRFGGARTLNLRALQPTAMQGKALAEQWLRSKQMEGIEEALVITGRGNRSVDGYSPVREAIVTLLPSLRRRNVIASFAEHTPGSFVVSFAPVRALFEAPKRRRERSIPAPPSTPTALRALDPETQRGLRELSTVALATLGIHSPTTEMVQDEMGRQFAQLASALPAGPDKDALLQQAVTRALEEYERD